MEKCFHKHLEQNGTKTKFKKETSKYLIPTVIKIWKKAVRYLEVITHFCLFLINVILVEL